MSGLTSRQEWTHNHIRRCTCGSWTVLTDRQVRAGTTQCKHLTPALARAEERAA